MTQRKHILKTIWKYELQPECTLDMPIGAQVLSVREQGGAICLWALVNPNAEKEQRHFVGFGTGHDVLDRPMQFIDSAHLGSLVFHVFELIGG